MAVRGQLLRIGVSMVYIYVLRGAIGGFVLSIAGKIEDSIARQLNTQDYSYHYTLHSGMCKSLILARKKWFKTAVFPERVKRAASRKKACDRRTGAAASASPCCGNSPNAASRRDGRGWNRRFSTGFSPPSTSTRLRAQRCCGTGRSCRISGIALRRLGGADQDRVERQ